MVPREASGGHARIGALLRVPYRYVRARIHADLVGAGFEDFHPAHLDVFQHPGPDGVAPSELAERTGMSRQAMNHLLGQLERGGYLRRDADRGERADGRFKVVHITRRGAAVLALIQRSLDGVEEEWRAALGKETFTALEQSLRHVNDLLVPRQPR